MATVLQYRGVRGYTQEVARLFKATDGVVQDAYEKAMSTYGAPQTAIRTVRRAVELEADNLEIDPVIRDSVVEAVMRVRGLSPR